MFFYKKFITFIFLGAMSTAPLLGARNTELKAALIRMYKNQEIRELKQYWTMYWELQPKIVVPDEIKHGSPWGITFKFKSDSLLMIQQIHHNSEIPLETFYFNIYDNNQTMKKERYLIQFYHRPCNFLHTLDLNCTFCEYTYLGCNLCCGGKVPYNTFVKKYAYTEDKKLYVVYVQDKSDPQKQSLLFYYLSPTKLIATLKTSQDLNAIANIAISPSGTSIIIEFCDGSFSQLIPCGDIAQRIPLTQEKIEKFNNINFDFK